MVRFVPVYAASALCMIGASQFTGALAYALWIAPIPLQYLASFQAVCQTSVGNPLERKPEFGQAGS